MCMMDMPEHMGMEMKQMGHRMGKGEGGFPLIGDKMPKMEVKTTHGIMTLPDAYAGKWFILSAIRATSPRSAPPSSLPLRRDGSSLRS